MRGKWEKRLARGRRRWGDEEGEFFVGTARKGGNGNKLGEIRGIGYQKNAGLDASGSTQKMVSFVPRRKQGNRAIGLKACNER